MPGYTWRGKAITMAFALLKPPVSYYHPLWNGCELYINATKNEAYFLMNGGTKMLNDKLETVLIPAHSISEPCFIASIAGYKKNLYPYLLATGGLVFKERSGLNDYTSGVVLFNGKLGWTLRVDGIIAEPYRSSFSIPDGTVTSIGVDAYICKRGVSLKIYPDEPLEITMEAWNGSKEREVKLTSSLDMISGWYYDESVYEFKGFSTKEHTIFQIGAGVWKYNKYTAIELSSLSGDINLSGFISDGSFLVWRNAEFPGGHFYCNKISIKKGSPFLMHWHKEEPDAPSQYDIEWYWDGYTMDTQEYLPLHIADVPAWR